MEPRLRSRASAACLITLLLSSTGSPALVEIRRLKNVQVSLRAKWPDTPLLLEAGELLAKEKDAFWEFTDLWLQRDRGADCTSARCCLERIVADGRSLLSEQLGSVFELSLTLRSASPRLVLYRQLAEDSLSSFPIDDDSGSAPLVAPCCSTSLSFSCGLTPWLKQMSTLQSSQSFFSTSIMYTLVRPLAIRLWSYMEHLVHNASESFILPWQMH